MQTQVVMKFGGTSLGTADNLERSCRQVARETRSRLVVVSAVGGVTDLLLSAASAAQAGQSHAAFLREIRKRHDEILTKLDLKRSSIEDLDAELKRLLKGISMLRELTPRVTDALVSLGERMSVRLTASALQQMGLPARAFDAWELGMLTDGQHGRAAPLDDAHERIRACLADLPENCLPVVTGFIGHSPEGVITTLGRGGSDFSAAVFGAAARVDEIQIWTDVPGFLRADPRAVDHPALIPVMGFDEAAELAYFGAKVLHPRTIEPALVEGIPVRVLGTFQVDPDDETPIDRQGTLIRDRAPGEPVRALALQKQVESVTIQSSGMLDAPGFLARVFDIFARHCISVDVVATSEVSVSLTFDRAGADLDAASAEIARFAQVERLPNRSLVCLVGAGLREDSLLLGRIFTALGKAGVPVHVISQGASRINLTLVTEPPYGVEAMRVLHRLLFESGDLPS